MKRNKSIKRYIFVSVLGCVGSGLLLLGVFLPLGTHQSNYICFADSKAGVILICLACISLLSSFWGLYRLLWITGVASLFLIFLLDVFESSILFLSFGTRSGYGTRGRLGLYVLSLGAILLLITALIYELYGFKRYLERKKRDGY